MNCNTDFEKQQGLEKSRMSTIAKILSLTCLVLLHFKGYIQEKKSFISPFFCLQFEPQAQKHSTAKAGYMGKQVLHIYIELLLLFCFVGGYCYWASLVFDGHIKGAALA